MPSCRMSRRLLVLVAVVSLLAACGSESAKDGGGSTGTGTGPGGTTPVAGASGSRAEADPTAAHRAPQPLTLADGTVVGAPPAGGTGAATSSSSSSTATSVVPPGPTPDLQSVIDAYRQRDGIVAIAAAVVRPGPGGEPQVTTYVSGTTASSGGTPLVPTNRFEMGSETKTFTAALLAHAVAEGRVAVTDPVQKYLPSGVTAPTWEDGTPITLADLATHQAGLPDEPPNLDDKNPAAKSQYTRAMLWAGLSQTKLLWKPGTRWLYSNFGWGLLGTILADLDQPGQSEPPFGPVVQSVLTGPLAMGSTALENCDVTSCPQTPNLVVPYRAPNQPAPYWNNVQALAGGGGLVTDIVDMSTWITAALGYPSAISSFATAPLQQVSTIATICTAPDKCQPSSMGFHMGLGWQLYDQGEWLGVPYAFKNGGTAGMHSTTYLVPGRQIGVTLLSNSPAAIDDLGKLLLLALDGRTSQG